MFKPTTRTEAQLRWLAECAARLRASGVVAPLPLPTLDKSHSNRGWTCEYLEPGRPSRFGEQIGLRAAIRRVHRTAFGLGQRPGFRHARAFLSETLGGDVDLTAMPHEIMRKLRAAFEAIPKAPLTLVHGNLTPSNIAVTPWGQFVFYDWDNARLDHPLFDLVAVGALDNPVPKRAALAFEIATCWRREPDYAMSLVARL